MANWRSIMVAVALFVIVAAGGFTIYQVADLSQDQAATNDNQVTNETLVQQVGIYQLVSVSTDEFTAGFNSSVTVYNNSSVELTEGEDYEWNETDGAILFKDTVSTNDGEQANITYEYYENTEGVKDMAGPIGVIVTALGQLPKMMAGLGLAVLFFATIAIVLRSRNNLQSRR